MEKSQKFRPKTRSSTTIGIEKNFFCSGKHFYYFEYEREADFITESELLYLSAKRLLKPCGN